jgi:RNA polymerase sigma factor (sigma-70 family)
MNDWDKLQEYARTGSEECFADLVRSNVDVVYSAALRLVRSPQIAEEVAQSVFADLARGASRLKPETNLTAWLYQVTRRTAIDVIRSEARRQVRERLAQEINHMSSDDATWSQIETLLDEAMAALGPEDRTAILLRFFQNKSLRQVGQSLGASDDAAQKRVSRAVERLREFLSRRGVTTGAAGLVALLSANAVQSAPIGLGSAITTSVVLAGNAVQTTATLGISKAIAMTTLQKTLISTLLAVAIGATLYEARRASAARATAEEAQRQQAPLSDQVSQLTEQRDQALKRLDATRQDLEELRRSSTDLLAMRAENNRLREDVRSLSRSKPVNPSAASETEAALKTWLVRVDQLKQRLQLSPDQKIPEMQLLSDQDWLNAAKGNLETEEDYRSAMASLRNAAQQKFAALAEPALDKYLKANNLQFPTDPTQLQPYFKQPLDAAILQRYTIKSADTYPNMRVGDGSVITQSSIVDEGRDSRIVIGSSGYGSFDALDSSNLRASLDPVMRAFADANNGREPSEPADLQPYITTPTQQAALDRAMRIFRQKQGKDASDRAPASPSAAR